MKYLIAFMCSLFLSACTLMNNHSSDKLEVGSSLKITKSILKNESDLYYYIGNKHINQTNDLIYKKILFKLGVLNDFATYLKTDLTSLELNSMREINAYCLATDFVLNYKSQILPPNEMYQPLLIELKKNQLIWIDRLSENKQVEINYSCLEKLKLQTT
ncbi:hypothetical protein ACF3NA_08355 [Alkanindiges sp. WGS2144]|uniref:hypothetical protein n=1 Tax=Alkanindiges sp. WGS2144 TaxID=3366808 RepID=UPI003752C691